MSYTQTIVVAKNTEIDTIQKALDAINTTNPVVYIYDGEYQFTGLALMSKPNTTITWIGNGLKTIIKFLSPCDNIDFYHETNFKKLRFKCDDSIPPYFQSLYVMEYFTSYNNNTKAVFENCLFDKSDNGLKPNYVFMFLHSSYTGTISNKYFINCTFNASEIVATVSIGNATFINCIYNTKTLVGLTTGESTITNTFKDDIDQKTFAPINYDKTNVGIYCGSNPMLELTDASEIIKKLVYDNSVNILKNKALITYSIDDNTENNISVMSEEYEANSFKDKLIKSINIGG